jgi:hypothetical protein
VITPRQGSKDGRKNEESGGAEVRRRSLKVRRSRGGKRSKRENERESSDDVTADM